MAKREWGITSRRNLALVGHRSTGKTSLSDRVCANYRVTREVGSVEAGTSLLDHHIDERKRKQSLDISSVWFESNEHFICLVDTPGTESLVHLSKIASTATDLNLLCVDAVKGPQLGDIEVLDEHRKTYKPTFIVLTKCERAADLSAVVELLEAECSSRVIPLQIPLTTEEQHLVGVVNVLEDVALRFSSEAQGEFSVEPVPAHLKPKVEQAYERICEAVALTDDGLLEEYLENFRLPREVVQKTLKKAVASGRVIPLFYTSARKNIGISCLIEGVIQWGPPPTNTSGERSSDEGAFVAETISIQWDKEGRKWGMFRVWSGTPPKNGKLYVGERPISSIRKWYSVRGNRRAAAKAAGAGTIIGAFELEGIRPGDVLTNIPVATASYISTPPMSAWTVCANTQEKSAAWSALEEQCEADPGLALRTDDVSGGWLLAGQTESHLALAISRIRSRRGITLSSQLPPVAYREVPCKEVNDVEAEYRKEDVSGLVSEFGRCRISLTPDSQLSNRFEDLVTDSDTLPNRFRPAINEGVEEALCHGPTAGYPVLGAHLTLVGGDYDILQSKDDHFHQAGALAATEALNRSGTRLMEPWWSLVISAPTEEIGEIISDITSHRGRIVGMEVDSKTAILSAKAPYRDIRTFETRLRAITSGRGSFSAEHSHYEPLPKDLTQEVILQSPFRSQTAGAQKKSS